MIKSEKKVSLHLVLLLIITANLWSHEYFSYVIKDKRYNSGLSHILSGILICRTTCYTNASTDCHFFFRYFFLLPVYQRHLYSLSFCLTLSSLFFRLNLFVVCCFFSLVLHLSVVLDYFLSCLFGQRPRTLSLQKRGRIGNEPTTSLGLMFGVLLAGPVWLTPHEITETVLFLGEKVALKQNKTKICNLFTINFNP